VLDLPVPVPAVSIPAGYTLESWSDPIPEAVLADVAALYDMLADAPHEDGEAILRWDAARVRDRLNGVVTQLGPRNYAIAQRVRHPDGSPIRVTQTGHPDGSIA
jgi:hypothetical protein